MSELHSALIAKTLHCHIEHLLEFFLNIRCLEVEQ